jgi:hypothetical protein
MQAMAEREARYALAGEIQVDDAYLGGERSGGKVGRGSENKVPFVAAVSISEDGSPLRAKLTVVPNFLGGNGSQSATAEKRRPRRPGFTFAELPR